MSKSGEKKEGIGGMGPPRGKEVESKSSRNGVDNREGAPKRRGGKSIYFSFIGFLVSLAFRG